MLRKPEVASGHSAPWLLALVAFALALLGARGLFEPDEGRYVAVALQMVESGDWLLPKLHHEVLHLSKPPLVYWSVAASLQLFGRSEWAARLPNAIAFILTVVLVAKLARTLAPGRELLAGMVYATSLLPTVGYQIVTTDTLLAFFETLAVWGFVQRELAVSGRSRVPWSAIGFSLAFLTKGPPGLLPALALGVWLLRFRGLPATLRKLFGPGLLLFLALIASWFVAVLLRHPEAWEYWIGREVVGRVASPEFHRNPGWRGLFEVYVPTLVAALLPWWPWAIRKRRLVEIVAPDRKPDPALWLIVLWVAIPLGVFLLAQSRLPLYLLPLAVPGSILLSRFLPADLLEARPARILLSSWIGLLVLLRALPAVVPSDRDGQLWAQRLRPLLTQPVDELVFVQRKPLYSLAFYLGTECERIELDGLEAALREPAVQAPAQTLAEELAEPIPDGLRRVWIVEGKHLTAFLNRTQLLASALKPLGQVGPYHLFEDDPLRRPR